MGHAIVGNEKGWIAKLLVYAIIAGALYAGYYYFQATPRFALIQVKRSIVFSDAEIAEQYIDFDRLISYLPEKMTRAGDKETVKKNLLREIDMPYEKSTFDSVKDWNTFTIPITVSESGNEATVEQEDGATIELQKISERQWVVTAIRFPVKGEK